jgi:uncharacterized protein (DUF433 family)
MLGMDRITFDPQIMGGRACIRGMRVSVSLVLNLIANGMSTEEIVGDYPYLEPEDIRQALQYAAWAGDIPSGGSPGAFSRDGYPPAAPTPVARSG